MKKILIFTLLIFCIPTLGADQCALPKKKEIIQTDSKGKTQTFSSDDYVVVKRRPKSAKPKQLPKPVEPEVRIIERPVVLERIVERRVEVEASRAKNSIFLLGGYGPVGLGRTQPSTVELERDWLLGLGYRKMLSARWSAYAEILTNRTGLLGLGIDF